MNDCYTYTLRYPTDYPVQCLVGVVFYIGKGTGSRINDHVLQARTGVKSAKCDVIRTIEAFGCAVVAEKARENMSDSEAGAHEEELIKTYGPENLTNIQSMRQFKPDPVRMALWFNGTLLEQIGECMARDGVAYSSDACRRYVRDICEQAISTHIQNTLKTP